MRKSILILAAALAAAPAFADKKLDDAVAKAESLAEKGRPEEGIKAVQKVADGSNSRFGRARRWIPRRKRASLSSRLRPRPR